MSCPSATIGFSLSIGYRWHHDRRRYRLSADGLRALEFVAHVAEHQPEPADVGWLLTLRDQIREIEQLEVRAALVHAIECTRHRRARIVAIWLRGRCRGRVGTKLIACLRRSADWTLRKEVVRCLQRLAAWSELRDIAESDPDPRIRRMAAQAPPRPFSVRLAAFSRHVPPHEVGHGPASLYVSPMLDVNRGRAPKTAEFIRMILARIQRVVHG